MAPYPSRFPDSCGGVFFAPMLAKQTPVKPSDYSQKFGGIEYLTKVDTHPYFMRVSGRVIPADEKQRFGPTAPGGFLQTLRLLSVVWGHIAHAYER